MIIVPFNPGYSLVLWFYDTFDSHTKVTCLAVRCRKASWRKSTGPTGGPGAALSYHGNPMRCTWMFWHISDCFLSTHHQEPTRTTLQLSGEALTLMCTACKIEEREWYEAIFSLRPSPKLTHQLSKGTSGYRFWRLGAYVNEKDTHNKIHVGVMATMSACSSGSWVIFSAQKY